MDVQNEKVSPKEDDVKVPESPKPLAFTIDFGSGKVDTERHKSLVEKYQKRHRRGQSLSKIEDVPANTVVKKHPLTGNLPRKASFQSEGYYSSDEKNERNRAVHASSGSSRLRDGLTLPLKNVTTDKMTQSYPNCSLPSISSPEVELKDISSPELDLISPYSPAVQVKSTPSPNINKSKVLKQYSSPECETRNFEPEEQFVDGTDFDFDQSDSVSDAGTYTLDADNYSEEQKARMSIDREFNIEQVSVFKKTEEYIQSLTMCRENVSQMKPRDLDYTVQRVQDMKLSDSAAPQKLTKHQNVDYQSEIDKSPNLIQSPTQTTAKGNVFQNVQKPYTHRNVAQTYEQKSKMLSPILSPTQNMSITQTVDEQKKLKIDNNEDQKTFTKIMLPSPKAKLGNGLEQVLDQGSVISVTSSGAFRPKSGKERTHMRKLSLTQSEVQVEAYTENSFISSDNFVHTTVIHNRPSRPNLTSNLVHVGESIPTKNNELKNNIETEPNFIEGKIVLGKITNLPPPVGGVSGKTSPTKIPSPIHTITRPRSRNSSSSLNVDLSDSSLETESYLKPTQNYINSLQQRLSLDSDNENEYETKFLNNDHRNLLKQKPTHVRHNSFDDRNLKPNKLEHFKNKNLLIDQTTNVFNQYQNKVQKIQNSPNNSPIRRSSSFSTKNQINTSAKCSNVQKESNLRNSPNLGRNGSIQRSASTASIKPNLLQLRRSSVSDHPKIDRNQFGDTESSSEEDFEKNLLKKKDITNTRYNRAFSLRRARLDEPVQQPLKCPNTPEMRRKFQPSERSERAISVDRKPTKTNEVQSRYLLNITRNKNVPPPKPETKVVPKHGLNLKSANKSQVFSRTDTGRFSMRSNKPPGAQVLQKPNKKDGAGKKQSGTRSNSSLSSREVEFQNWKRRKSYDPMKAAAEGKKKAELAKKQNQTNVMTQSYNESQNQDYDSSPSHSSSVHRSQSFHGTAALEQLISSDEEDLTLSADEGFSPPTPSPCELSPARASLRYAWKDRLMH